MKNLNLALITIGLTALSPLCFAVGNENSGGGNAPGSSREEIQEAVDLIPMRLLTFIGGASKGELPTDVAEAFKRFNVIHSMDKEYGQPITSAEWSVNHTKYTPASGPCYDKDRKERDSAVTAFSLGSPVCMSLTRLARIPRETLDRTVTALAAHELAHQVGLGETEALQVQLYVTEMYDNTYGGAGVTCYVSEFKDWSGKVTGYQVKFGIWQDCTYGCATGYIFDADKLNTALPMLRNSLLGRKIGRDGGCTTFTFR